MRLGYAAINRRLSDAGVRSNRTFRLASYTPERLLETVAANLRGLRQLLAWNAAHNLLAFRVTSDIVPFGSHPVLGVDWVAHFASELTEIGTFVQAHGMRLSLHPGQYTLINSPTETIHAAALADLQYHAALFDAMGLDRAHKVQIHLGGAYGDKPASLRRFRDRYDELPEAVRRRLVIENDDRIYGLADCLEISRQKSVPVLLDTFHLSVLEPDTPLGRAIDLAAATWGRIDGPLLIDYSSQEPGKRVGAHADHIDLEDFAHFRHTLNTTPADVILEIKDKETSALAVTAAQLV